MKRGKQLLQALDDFKFEMNKDNHFRIAPA